MFTPRFLITILALTSLNASAAVQVAIGHHPNDTASAGFSFTNVSAPVKNDAASTAKFSIVAGRADGNSAGLAALTDGFLPGDEDEPNANFFFAPGTDGGRLAVDLGRVIEIKQVNTYSWHPGSRGPQVYTLYGSKGGDFNARPARDIDPLTCGWTKVAAVDTRPANGQGGGQYGVSITDPTGALGSYQHLLFDIARTAADDSFANTFLSEVDVVDLNGPAPVAAGGAREVFKVATADGATEIHFDTTRAPELKEWAERKLAPVLAEWWPKLVALLPSDHYVTPKQVRITFRPGDDVAFAAGTRITANSTWLKRELQGEAVGALIHELVHVVQHCGAGQRRNSGGGRTPGWLVEGIPDYIRFFKFEPETHGADILWLEKQRNPNLRYDAKYRVTANFIHYVVANHDQAGTLLGLVSEACGAGAYRDELWQELTGKTLPELNDAWKTAVAAELAARVQSGLNVLTDAERRAGWRLLFNGVDLAGWHNFRREGVRPGWQVKDGALVCADPKDAGDIVTADKFGAFELQLEYNISEAGNSGIIFHVSDEGGAVWASGPEFQLEDNAKAKDPQRCGWLYGLYQPPDDPKTGKPLDATKPAGEWNQVRLVISPVKCEHWINGVKYFDYVIGSDDFKERVAKSKFGKMPLFAKAGSGRIALQGDHGQVSFRNVKIRPLRGDAAQTSASKE